MRERRVNWLCTLVAILVMIFLVAPLVVIVIASFTPTALVTFPPQGFSLKWYANIFTSSTHFMDGLVKFRFIGVFAFELVKNSLYVIHIHVSFPDDSRFRLRIQYSRFFCR